MSKDKKIGQDGSDGAGLVTRLRTEAADGNNIRNWRLFLNIETQAELAKLTVEHDPDKRGISRVAILKLENGELRYNEDHLRLLSRALGIAPRDLIGTNPYDAGDIFAVYAGLSGPAKRRAAKLIASLKN